MLSRIRGFVSRHRRKFFGVAVAGALIWGGWSYFNWRMRRYEEEYVREVLNRAKRHMHHTSSAQAAEKQAVALIPVATKATNRALDTNAIVCELKGAATNEHSEKLNSSSSSLSKRGKGIQLSYEEKIIKWDELKRVTVARAVAYAYVPSILIVFLRLQLGLLGGYVFRSCGGDNVDVFLNGGEEKQKKGEKQDSMPVEIQEAYLSLSQYFLERKSSAITKQLEIASKRPQESLLCKSYWAENRSDQDIVKGKSKLNLNFPVASLNEAVSETCSFNSQSHKDLLSHSVKRPIEKQKSSGDMKNMSECSSGIAVGSSSCSKVQVDKKESSPPCENKITSLSSKEHILQNGETDLCDTSGSGVQGCELTHVGVSEDEIGSQKDSGTKDVVEEDSGRCSGIDEEEVLEDRMMNSGIESLCSLLEKKVGRVVDGTSLKMQLSLADTETLFWGMLTSIRANPAEDPAFNLPKYLLPPPDVLKGMAEELETQLDSQASSIFLEMVSETADLLETKEVVELVQSCVSAGFGHIMDKLANYFPQDTLSLSGTVDATKTAERNSSQQTVPMAKLIPIINKVAFEEGTPWFIQLLEMSNLKDFGANVYEAFTH